MTYPPQAWEKRTTDTAPTLADDVLQENYEQWAAKDGQDAPPMTDEAICKWMRALKLSIPKKPAARLAALRKHFSCDEIEKDSDDSDASEGSGT